MNAGLLLLLITASVRASVLNKRTFKNVESVLNVDSNNNDNEKIVLNMDNDELCNMHFQQYRQSLKEGEEWALNMFDATSKLQSGILAGNFAEMGNFKQCLSVIQKFHEQNTTIRGKYCFGHIKEFPNFNISFRNQERLKIIEQNIHALTRMDLVGLRWAGCIPDSCSANLGSDIINKILLTSGIKVQFSEDWCTTKSDEPDFTSGDIAVICLFATLTALVVLSTIYDFYVRKTSKTTPHILYVSFSAYTNSKQLFKISKSTEQLSCLGGIRVLSLMWIVLIHIYGSYIFSPIANINETLEWADSKYSMYIIGGSVAVDSFLLLSGLLVAYVFLRVMLKKQKFNLLTYYCHRYLRLTPALLGIMLVHLTLLKHFGSGPMYNTFLSRDDCAEDWWTNLLYMQNYIHAENMALIACVHQTWYLAVDMQLFILSPIILIPLWKRPKMGLVLLVLLIFGSIAMTFNIAWVNDYHTPLIPQLKNHLMGNSSSILLQLELKTHCRATPWLIGIGLGYFIYKFKEGHSSYVFNKVLSAILTGFSLSVLCTCVFAGHDIFKKEYVKFEHVAYFAFLRPSWALALAWLIYASVIGQTGAINWLLSLPIFQVIGRFSYSVYLLHYTLINMAVSSRKIPNYFSDYNAIHQFWGDFMFSLILAYFWILMFESPVIAIEKFVFRRVLDKSKFKKETDALKKDIDITNATQ